MQEPEWTATDPVQAEVLAAFLAEMKSQWVWLYRSQGEIGDHSVGQYSAMLTQERAAQATSGPGWEVEIGSGSYGFSEYYNEGKKETRYERYPGEGAELLVYYRDWNGVRPAEMEVAEEFRLLFNLWEDRTTRTYYYFDGSGNPIKAVVIEARGVRALANLVRRYQAAKQVHLALYLDSTRFAKDLLADGFNWDHANAATVLAYYRGDTMLGGPPFSRLFGKRLFPPPPREKSGFWPYEPEKEYESFLIGTNEMGEEVSFTSNPDELANYFGANRGNPHYLTPVYFRPEVLNKYYADPDRYSVEDGYLRCAGLWGLRIDNDRPGQVMVFLGDLGRDIPQDEARYWRTFNIQPPEHGPSDTLVRRAILGQFADPASVDLRFPVAYRKANQAWERAFRYPLFKELHPDDRHVLTSLRVPISDGQAEFDQQVLYLAKLLVDSLNEKAIGNAMGPGPKGEKGLAKLERFLVGADVPDARELLTPFANVQGLRSLGAAHRKGAEFDMKVAIGELGRREGFSHLMEATIGALDRLREVAEHRTRES